MPYWVDYCIGFCVGVIGGLCYSNIFFILLKNEKIPVYYVEAASNFLLITGNFAVVLAALCVIFLDKFIIIS